MRVKFIRKLLKPKVLLATIFFLSIIYLLRSDIMLGSLRIYTNTGDPEASLYIAKKYEKLSSQHYKKALVSLKKRAARTQNTDKRAALFYQIGSQYEYGKGVKPNAQAALIWYRKAIQLGSRPAKTAENRLTKQASI